MPPHLHGAHAPGLHRRRAPAPPPTAPLRHAERLALWHEPPALRPAPRRRNPWPTIAAFAVITACLGLSAWTHTAQRPSPDATIIGRAGQ